MASPDVLQHPVRLRVVQALLGERSLTTAQLAEELPDVPKPSLYRHVAALTQAGVLAVTGERRVRGAVERTFRLEPGAASADTADVSAMTDDEQRAAFAVFTAGLGAAFEAFLAEGQGGAHGYRTAALHLAPGDAEELAARVREAVSPWLAPRAGARRYLLSTVLLPAGPTQLEPVQEDPAEEEPAEEESTGEESTGPAQEPRSR